MVFIGSRGCKKGADDGWVFGCVLELKKPSRLGGVLGGKGAVLGREASMPKGAEGPFNLGEKGRARTNS